MNSLSSGKTTKLVVTASLILSALAFLCFVYTDVGETTRQGLNLIKSIAQGRLSEFYVMCENCPMGEMGYSVVATYDIPLFTIFAIWDIPLYIYENVTGLSCLDTFLGIMWAKAILIPFMVVLIYEMISIGKLIKKEEFSTLNCMAVIFTSVLFFIPAAVMGQYDVLSAVFIMLGVKGYIEGDNKKFILGFAIANLFKMFSLFLFIPLLLLKEKKFIKLVLDMLAGCSLLLITKVLQAIIFIPSEAADIFVKDHLLSFFFQGHMKLVYDGASLFVICLIILCFYCYFKKTPDVKELGMWTLYIGFLSFAIFFVTSFTHPQWNLLLLPFTTLIICCCERRFMSAGLLIDTVMSCGLLLAEVVFYDGIFNSKLSRFTLAGKLFYEDVGYYATLKDVIGVIFSGINVDFFNFTGGGIFTAGMIFFAIWAYPGKSKERFADIDIPVNGMYIFRLLVLLISSLAFIALLFVGR